MTPKKTKKPEKILEITETKILQPISVGGVVNSPEDIKIVLDMDAPIKDKVHTLMAGGREEYITHDQLLLLEKSGAIQLDPPEEPETREEEDPREKYDLLPDRKNKELTLKQKSFCEIYATDRSMFGNGTQAYIEAYDIDTSTPGKYASARVRASELLTNRNILACIRGHLDTAILNHEFVDRELAFVIEQCADMPSKMRAIEQYNKVKSRITEKIEHKVEGSMEGKSTAELEGIIAKRKEGEANQIEA